MAAGEVFGGYFFAERVGHDTSRDNRSKRLHGSGVD